MFEFYVVAIYIFIMFIVFILDFTVNNKSIRIGNKKIFIKINIKTYVRSSILYFFVFFVNKYLITSFGFDLIYFNFILNLLFSIFVGIYSVCMDFIISDINTTINDTVEIIRAEKENLEIEEKTTISLQDIIGEKETIEEKKELAENGIREKIESLEIMIISLINIVLFILIKVLF